MGIATILEVKTFPIIITHTKLLTAYVLIILWLRFFNHTEYKAHIINSKLFSMMKKQKCYCMHYQHVYVSTIKKVYTRLQH